MSKLLKEITFDIMKSTEVDLAKPVISKKRRKKRNDDYDYEDDFIEAFEGESEPVEIECSLNNFFVFQGPLPYSTKKVLNFFKNKPVLQVENDNEVELLEEALCLRRKRKASPTLAESVDEDELAKPKKGRRGRSADNREYHYKDPVIAYLYEKLVRLQGRIDSLSVDEKIWFFITNYILYDGYPNYYERNIKLLEGSFKTEINKITDNQQIDKITDNEIIKITDNQQIDKVTDNQQIDKTTDNENKKTTDNENKKTTDNLKIDKNNINKSDTLQSFDYTSPSSFLPPTSFVPSAPPSSIDTPLYTCISKYFTDKELEDFISDMITRIDNALVSITVTASNETMYSPTNRKFLGFSDKAFKDECAIYFTNYVVKHYASNTSHDIMYYYHEAKKSVMDVFLECSNKVKTLYYVNQHYKSLIDDEKFDY